MQIKLTLSVALLAGSAVWAADAYTPLNVKTGEWETTMTMQMSGMPPIPEELLARLTPEQRAKMEAALKAKGAPGAPARTTTHKGCLKKEDLEKPFPFKSEEQRACKTTVVSSSRTKEEVRFDCAEGQFKGTGTIIAEALSPESVKITSQGSTGDGTHNMTVVSNGTAKWLGAACTESK